MQNAAAPHQVKVMPNLLDDENVKVFLWVAHCARLDFSRKPLRNQFCNSII